MKVRFGPQMFQILVANFNEMIKMIDFAEVYFISLLAEFTSPILCILI